MDKRYLKDFNKEERQSFYQSKYDYYKTLIFMVMSSRMKSSRQEETRCQKLQK